MFPFIYIKTPTNSRLLENSSKPRTVFQTPIYETHTKKARTESLETPKMSATLHTSDAIDPALRLVASSETNITHENEDASTTLTDNGPEIEINANNSSTPLISDRAKPFNTNNIKMFYKSEPNLSKVVSDRSSTPIFNRGKHIAKKLFNSVSMINLRRSIAHGQNTMADVDKMHSTASSTLLLRIMTDNDASKTTNNINEPKLRFASEHNSNVLISNDCDGKDVVATDVIEPMGRESESPITKSTHRMSKAMQVIRVEMACASIRRNRIE